MFRGMKSTTNFIQPVCKQLLLLFQQLPNRRGARQRDYRDFSLDLRGPHNSLRLLHLHILHLRKGQMQLKPLDSTIHTISSSSPFPPPTNIP